MVVAGAGAVISATLLFLLFGVSQVNAGELSIINENESLVQTEIQERLRNRLEAQPILEGALEAAGTVLYSQHTLPSFYSQNGFKPVWVGNGEDRIQEMIEGIKSLRGHGLNPANYHLDQIETYYEAFGPISKMTTRQMADLELLLTDAFLLSASHLSAGQLNPETFDPNWRIVRDEVDYAELLLKLQRGDSVSSVIRQIQPAHRRYVYLMQALERYREIAAAGGWPEVRSEQTLRQGDEHSAVALLRERLYLAGDFPDSYVFDENSAGNPMFDQELHNAVVRFQNRHGLDADGVVGRNTLAAVNTPVELRVQQVMLNLERWRWLRRHLGERHILVNIADFKVEVVENGQPVMEMRAIVGRQYRQTPVFSSRMTYLVLSPFWNLPPGITRNDIVPRMRQNPSYAAEQNMKIFEGWGADAREVKGEDIDWNAPNVATRYRFRQEPGPNNALGIAKFMFPNPFHVYLHDTPSRDLFARTQRDFSSGCIRIEKPLELTEYLLQDNSRWNRTTIMAAVQERRERTVTLSEPIWVHILYWTAWSDADGTIHFRNDIYGRDTRLMDAMKSEMNLQFTSM